MKVCMILMNEFTHDARVEKEAQTLINAGHQVTIIALKSRSTPQLETRNHIKIKRVRLITRYALPKNQIFFFMKYIEFIFQSVRVSITLDADVYHAHDLETLPIGFILSKLKRKPLIYDSHELYIESKKHHHVAKKMWYIIEKILVPKTTINIIVNESLQKIFSKRYRVKHPEVVMNCQYFRPLKKSNILREQLKISKNKKIILYQGGISKTRGIDILIKSMESLQNFVLILVGPGEYKELLKIKYKKKKNIFILDTVPWKKLAEYTAGADIGVSLLQNDCLNNFYSLPNKIFEYLSAGIPVLFSDFPELRKIIIDNNVGKVVDQNDANAVASAIKSIIQNKDLYKTMSQNARSIVEKKYNWEIEGQKLLKIYDKIYCNRHC